MWHYGYGIGKLTSLTRLLNGMIRKLHQYNNGIMGKGRIDEEERQKINKISKLQQEIEI